MVFYDSQTNTLINMQEKKLCSGGKKEREREGERVGGGGREEEKVLFTIFKDGIEHHIRVYVCVYVGL